MKDNPITLTISIVNTNNKELLLGCLQSVYHTTKKTSFEIIVVDNKSNDGSSEMVRERFPEVRLIENTDRLGYGHNHNRAFEVSRGEYFLVFNEDMIIQDDALDKMVELIRHDPTIGALGCKLLNPDGTLQPTCWNEYTPLRALFEYIVPYNLGAKASRFRTALYQWPHDSFREVGVIQGSCMLIPRETALRTGLFDQQFFLYYDETDLCKRIRALGKRVCYTPDGRIIHYGGQSTKPMGAISQRIFLQSRFKYYVKHHGLLWACLLHCVQTVATFLRLLGWAALVILSRRKNQLAIRRMSRCWNSLKWCLRPSIT